MAPEIDPVLKDTQNWDSHSHRALYESVHVNNDPGQSGEIGFEWIQFATELSESAQVITERIVATETGWTGESADGARTAIKKLSDWISGTAQTAGQVGDRVADQGRVMQDARAAMPEPVEFTWNGATGNMVGGGISGLLASTADVQVANAKAQAAKELAVTVMTNMETNSRAIDQSTPVFTPPFNPVTGRTQEPQLVALRRVEARTAGGAVDSLPMMATQQARLEAVAMGERQEAVASDRTTAAAAAYAPPLMPGTSFDGGGGYGGGGAGSGGYAGGSGSGGYTGGSAAGGGYAGGVPGGYTGGGAYKSSTGGRYSDDSDEMGSAYRPTGTTTAADAASSVPVANPYHPPVVGGYAGAGGYSDTTNYNGSGGNTGYGGGISGTTGRGSSPSRTPASGSAGNPAGYLGSPGARPPGVPAEGIGGTGSTGRGAGGYGGGAGAGGFGGGVGAGGFGGSAGGVGGAGGLSGSGGVGGSGSVGGAGSQMTPGGSTGVVQPGRGQMPAGAFPAGAQGGAAGGPMGGAPMGGAGGRGEEDKEHKSASYIMGGDLFDMPGENLPPSVIGGVKPKKKSGDQS